MLGRPKQRRGAVAASGMKDNILCVNGNEHHVSTKTVTKFESCEIELAHVELYVDRQVPRQYSQKSYQYCKSCVHIMRSHNI